MRVVRLILLGLLAYIVSVVFLFPVAPIADYVKPRIKPVELSNVSGKLFSGQVGDVKYADDLLPLEFKNVTWKLAPATLLKGGAGANVTFEGYGGGGVAQVRGQINGDIIVSDADFNANAKELEVLLPGPVADFAGKITGRFSTVKLANNLLQTLEGQLNWDDAIIVTRLYGPEFAANLGKLNINIEPQDNAAHMITIKSAGGDLSLDGTVAMAGNGDYQTNLLLTPSANAPRQLVQTLQRMTRPDGGGRFKIQHSGNVNQGT